MTQIQPDTSPQLQPAPPPRQRKSCLRCGCITGMGLLALILIAGFAFRIYFRNTLGPERLAKLEKLESEVVSLPPEWPEKATLPPDEVVQFQLSFIERTQELNDRLGETLLSHSSTGTLLHRLRHGDEITSGEQQTLEDFMVAVMPLIEETSAAVSMSGYTADMHLYTTAPAFLQQQIFAKFASIAALEQASRGDCTGAMDIAALPIRAMDSPAPSTLIHELVRVACTNISVATLHALADRCDDPAALRHGIAVLNELRDDVAGPDEDVWRLTDWAATLTRAKAFGYPVDLSPQPYPAFAMKVSDIYGRPYNEWAVAKLPEADPRARTARERLDVLNEYPDAPSLSSDVLGNKVLLPVASFVLGVSPTAMMAEVAVPNFEEAHTRSQVMVALYDITRLHFANRLAQLEGSAVAPGPPAAAAYLQTVPADPFTSNPMPFKPDTSQFYSFGPDKDDDQVDTVYDATNGTLSNGDVIMDTR